MSNYDNIGMMGHSAAKRFAGAACAVLLASVAHATTEVAAGGHLPVAWHSTSAPSAQDSMWRWDDAIFGASTAFSAQSCASQRDADAAPYCNLADDTALGFTLDLDFAWTAPDTAPATASNAEHYAIAGVDNGAGDHTIAGAVEAQWLAVALPDKQSVAKQFYSVLEASGETAAHDYLNEQGATYIAMASAEKWLEHEDYTGYQEDSYYAGYEWDTGKWGIKKVTAWDGNDYTLFGTGDGFTYNLTNKSLAFTEHMCTLHEGLDEVIYCNLAIGARSNPITYEGVVPQDPFSIDVRAAHADGWTGEGMSIRVDGNTQVYYDFLGTHESLATMSRLVAPGVRLQGTPGDPNVLVINDIKEPGDRILAVKLGGNISFGGIPVMEDVIVDPTLEYTFNEILVGSATALVWQKFSSLGSDDIAHIMGATADDGIINVAKALSPQGILR